MDGRMDGCMYIVNEYEGDEYIMQHKNGKMAGQNELKTSMEI